MTNTVATEKGRAIVFDMDGVMIDSEPLWRRAEIACFGEVGVSLSDADCLETMGLRIDEVADYWFERSPWQGATTHEVAGRIIERMRVMILAEGVPMSGVHESIAAAIANGWRLALASSSPKILIDAVLQRFALSETFEVVRSAEDEEYGKPHPDVYRSAVRDLKLDPANCIAIEDSANGVASAVAAGLRCVAIPESGTEDDPRFDIASWRLTKLAEFPSALPGIEPERVASAQPSTTHPLEPFDPKRAHA